MTAPATATQVCSWCGTAQPVTGLIRRLKLGHVGDQVVCEDDTACADRVRAASTPGEPEPHEDRLAGYATGAVYLEDPVSGRSEPRPEPSGGPHRLQFLDLTGTWTEADGVRFGPFRVTCRDEPGLSVWARAFEAGDYTPADLERLVRQHHGQEDPVPG